MILSDTKKAKSNYAIKHDAELTVHDEGYVFSPSIFPFIFFLLLLNFKYRSTIEWGDSDDGYIEPVINTVTDAK